MVLIMCALTILNIEVALGCVVYASNLPDAKHHPQKQRTI